ncbi:trichodiene synthase (TRI5) domain-containing protein [Hirsutella rhossiliensis]
MEAIRWVLEGVGNTSENITENGVYVRVSSYCHAFQKKYCEKPCYAIYSRSSRKRFYVTNSMLQSIRKTHNQEDQAIELLIPASLSAILTPPSDLKPERQELSLCYWFIVLELLPLYFQARPISIVQETLARNAYRANISNGYENLQTPIPPSAYDLSIENAVIKYFHTRAFAADFLRRTMPIIQAGAWIATIQEAIAIYTALAVMIEDTSKENLDELKAFQRRLFRRESQPNQLLEAMAHFTGTLYEIYGPFICDMIAKSTAEFISVCAFEQEYEGKLALTPSTPDFPYYLRLKTGIGEVYSFFAFPQILYPEDSFLHIYLPVIPDLIRHDLDQLFNGYAIYRLSDLGIQEVDEVRARVCCPITIDSAVDISSRKMKSDSTVDIYLIFINITHLTTHFNVFEAQAKDTWPPPSTPRTKDSLIIAATTASSTAKPSTATATPTWQALQCYKDLLLDVKEGGNGNCEAD